MRVFLGNGPWNRPGYYGVKAGSRWPHFETECSQYMPFPFYLAYATAVLEEAGYECRLVDGIGERISEEAFIQRAVEFQPDLIVLEVSTPSLATDLHQAEILRNRLPSAKIALCGLLIPPEDYDFLKENRCVDFHMVGEYDYTARDLAECLQEGRDPATVEGLIYFDETAGKSKATSRRPNIKDLDALPWPARHHLPMENYHDRPGGIPAPSLQMWASRGCPFRCIFCVWPQLMYGGHSYITRDPVNVVNEIEWCRDKYGFQSFYFDDDTFNIGKPRMLKLAEEIRKRQLNMPWAAMCRADTTDRETLVALKQAGLVAVKYGVESPTQSLVDAADKGLNIEQAEETIQYTKELGIKIHLTFSFGLPGETHQTARKTIRWSHKMSPDTIQYSIMTPFPGSRFYKLLEQKGHLLTKDWNKFDGNSMSVVRTDELTGEDIEEYLKKAYRSWEWHRFRRALIDPVHMKAALRNPFNGLRRLKEGFRNAARI